MQQMTNPYLDFGKAIIAKHSGLGYYYDSLALIHPEYESESDEKPWEKNNYITNVTHLHVLKEYNNLFQNSLTFLTQVMEKKVVNQFYPSFELRIEKKIEELLPGVEKEITKRVTEQYLLSKSKTEVENLDVFQKILQQNHISSTVSQKQILQIIRNIENYENSVSNYQDSYTRQIQNTVQNVVKKQMIQNQQANHIVQNTQMVQDKVEQSISSVAQNTLIQQNHQTFDMYPTVRTEHVVQNEVEASMPTAVQNTIIQQSDQTVNIYPPARTEHVVQNEAENSVSSTVQNLTIQQNHQTFDMHPTARTEHVVQNEVESSMPAEVQNTMIQQNYQTFDMYPTARIEHIVQSEVEVPIASTVQNGEIQNKELQQNTRNSVTNPAVQNHYDLPDYAGDSQPLMVQERVLNATNTSIQIDSVIQNAIHTQIQNAVYQQNFQEGSATYQLIEAETENHFLEEEKNTVLNQYIVSNHLLQLSTHNQELSVLKPVHTVSIQTVNNKIGYVYDTISLIHNETIEHSIQDLKQEILNTNIVQKPFDSASKDNKNIPIERTGTAYTDKETTILGNSLQMTENEQKSSLRNAPTDNRISSQGSTQSDNQNSTHSGNQNSIRSGSQNNTQSSNQSQLLKLVEKHTETIFKEINHLYRVDHYFSSQSGVVKQKLQEFLIAYINGSVSYEQTINNIENIAIEYVNSEKQVQNRYIQNHRSVFSWLFEKNKPERMLEKQLPIEKLVQLELSNEHTSGGVAPVILEHITDHVLEQNVVQNNVNHVLKEKENGNYHTDVIPNDAIPTMNQKFELSKAKNGNPETTSSHPEMASNQTQTPSVRKRYNYRSWIENNLYRYKNNMSFLQDIHLQQTSPLIQNFESVAVSNLVYLMGDKEFAANSPQAAKKRMMQVLQKEAVKATGGNTILQSIFLHPALHHSYEDQETHPLPMPVQNVETTINKPAQLFREPVEFVYETPPVSEKDRKQIAEVHDKLEEIETETVHNVVHDIEFVRETQQIVDQKVEEQIVGQKKKNDKQNAVSAGETRRVMEQIEKTIDRKMDESVEQIANKVYRNIEDRLRSERNRRGY